MRKTFASFLAGAAGALVLVVACSNDATDDADAAACDCDPAEPPLAGRIVRVEVPFTGSSAVLSTSARCADGATLLGGGCHTDPLNNNLRLAVAGWFIDDLSYGCTWVQTGSEQITVVAWATCLNPAPGDTQ